MTPHPDTAIEFLRAWTARPEWMQHAACRGVDPSLFYPERGGDSEQAKRVCTACPVAAECRQMAEDGGERFGVWGGVSARTRRNDLAANPRVLPAIEHGTARGYRSHLRRLEPACLPCRQAHAVDVSFRKRASALREAS